MKQVKIISFVLGWIIPVLWMIGCSDQPETGSVPPEVKISADKTFIKANNKDMATFTVTVDDEEINSLIAIIQTGKPTPVEGMSFSTDSAASYTFFATYQEIKSNEITIEAIDIELLLTADKQTVKANEKDTVAFSVKADDEDVTSFATIIYKEYPDSTLVESGFYTKTPGTYTFYALYDGKKSNEIQVEASAVVLSLTVDRFSIPANNSDKALFTVKADDEDVTSAAVIMQQRNRDDEALESPEFLTDEAATYTFYAIYDDNRSNEINVEATFVELAFLRGYSIVEISSNRCAPCPLMIEEVRRRQQTLPGQLHVITLHPSGKYCDSELAGALAQTAIDFADKANMYSVIQPLAIIDLHDPVYLASSVTTEKRLKDAVDRATQARNRVSLTGMAVQSKVNDNRIDFEVRFKTKKADTYRFFAFVVEDGVVHRQMVADLTLGVSVADMNYVHNDLAVYQLAEGDPFMGVDLGTLWTSHETTRFFSINMNNFDTGRDVNLANCRIVCYTLRTNDGTNYIVDNVTTCPVNGSVRYLYEK